MGEAGKMADRVAERGISRMKGDVQKEGERQGRNGTRRAMEIEGWCMRTDGG